MNLDYGRKMDLEELQKAIAGARSLREREHYEKIAFRIMNESAPVQSLRTDLISAFRAKDMHRVKAIEHHIQQIKLNESYGKSWGNNNGNKI